MQQLQAKAASVVFFLSRKLQEILSIVYKIRAFTDEGMSMATFILL